jgi:transposase-like protein
VKTELRIAQALERIADAMEFQNGLLAPQESGETACLHPEDERENLSTMGHPRWKCKACGFSVGLDN